MTHVRLAVAGLWAAGLVLGSFSERGISSSPLVHDGFQVLSADLHVHSFPGDGALPPWALASEARRRGLDAIALTNHNQMLSWKLAGWFRSPASGVLLLPGEEVTTPSFHMAAVGVQQPVDWDRSAALVAARVHAAGGVAIAAHPDDRAVEALDSVFGDLDGIEAAHPVRHLSDQAGRELNAAAARALREHPSIAQIGSSDFHYLAPIGLCRTYIFARAATVKDVLDAIREDRTVACDARGVTYGDPRLSLVVADACRRAASSDSNLDPRLNRIAVLCAWLGAVGLTLTGPRRG
jgi:predicted metal-dependent phosphoesterase TrpH